MRDWARDINESIIAAFDVELIRYSIVNSVGNFLLPNLQMVQLGNNQVAVFGWNDIKVFRFGSQWK
jgi:long-chain fatty acid transport protein